MTRDLTDTICAGIAVLVFVMLLALIGWVISGCDRSHDTAPDGSFTPDPCLVLWDNMTACGVVPADLVAPPPYQRNCQADLGEGGTALCKSRCKADMTNDCKHWEACILGCVWDAADEELHTAEALEEGAK